MPAPRRNPGFFWFLFFWGSVILGFLALNEMFGPVSLLDELKEKWDLLGVKAQERQGR